MAKKKRIKIGAMYREYGKWREYYAVIAVTSQQ